MKTTHHALKAQIIKAVDEAYEKAYAGDVALQAKKPALLKHVDVSLDKLLRPLFT